MIIFNLTDDERNFQQRLYQLFDLCVALCCQHGGAGNRYPLCVGIAGTSKNYFRRLFASGQSPTGKIFGGYVQVATLKSSCIGLLVHTLKIHPIEFLEIPLRKSIGHLYLLCPAAFRVRAKTNW